MTWCINPHTHNGTTPALLIFPTTYFRTRGHGCHLFPSTRHSSRSYVWVCVIVCLITRGPPLRSRSGASIWGHSQNVEAAAGAFPGEFDDSSVKKDETTEDRLWMAGLRKPHHGYQGTTRGDSDVDATGAGEVYSTASLCLARPSSILSPLSPKK